VEKEKWCAQAGHGIMLVVVVATLCLIADPAACIERVVTDQATLMECEGAFAAQVLPSWMEEQGYSARGYRLAKWGCSIGGRRSKI
jgi:hypothetical protein